MIRLLRRDRQGLEGLPLKLLIVALLISISFPCVWETLAYYDNVVIFQETTREVEEINDAAVSAYMAGPENVRLVKIRIRESLTGESPVIELGGQIDSPEVMLIAIIWRDVPSMTFFLRDPAFSLITADGHRLTIGPGETDLRLTCVRTNTGRTIVAEIA